MVAADHQPRGVAVTSAIAVADGRLMHSLSEKASGAALAMARRYADLGLCIIPIAPPRYGQSGGQPTGGKVPTIAWTPYQFRRPTDAELTKWFSSGDWNLGVVTGAVSGVVVVDLDTTGAARWWVRHRPFTPWQVRTARGWHLYYRHPDDRVGNRVNVRLGTSSFAMDVRGDGGYVVGPGSLHASGAQYREAGDWTVPATSLPAFWRGWVDTDRHINRPALPSPMATRGSGQRQSTAQATVIERARRYLLTIPQPQIGAGSDDATLYAAARLVRGFRIPPSVAEQLLWDWAGHRVGWTRQWIAKKVRNAERYGTEPWGGMA